MRILMMSNRENHRSTLHIGLSSYGSDVWTVSGLHEGFACIQEGCVPDVIVIDIVRAYDDINVFLNLIDHTPSLAHTRVLVLGHDAPRSARAMCLPRQATIDMVIGAIQDMLAA